MKGTAPPIPRVAPIAGDATARTIFPGIAPHRRERAKATKAREKGKKEETGARAGMTRERVREKAGKEKASCRSLITIIIGPLQHNPLHPPAQYMDLR